MTNVPTQKAHPQEQNTYRNISVSYEDRHLVTTQHLTCSTVRDMKTGTASDTTFDAGELLSVGGHNAINGL